MRKIEIGLLFCAVLILAGCMFVPVPVPLQLTQTHPPDKTAMYGERVSYVQGASIHFPDFILTYLGTRHGKSDKVRSGFIYYDFRIALAGETLIVSWSSGMDDIGPALFASGGYNYRLERGYSDQLGRLADNELVI